jgi:hypothetical protein
MLEMSHPSYVCTVCSQQFTRKYSGHRHNFNIHGGSEIVPIIEYMVGRSSGQFLASHPSWFRKRRQLQANRSYPSDNRVIPDTSSLFRPETLLQPYPLPAALLNSHTTTIQQKLEELRILLGKFSSQQNAYVTLELAKYNLRQGDESFLNETLKHLHTLDR